MEQLKRNDIDSYIAEMIRLTQIGEMTWTSVSREACEGFISSDDKFRSAFTTRFRDYFLRASRYSVKIQRSSVISRALDQPSVTYKPVTRLEFTDRFGNSLWVFPTSTLISDLISTIGYQTANVEGFFKSLDETKGSK